MKLAEKEAKAIVQIQRRETIILLNRSTYRAKPQEVKSSFLNVKQIF